METIRNWLSLSVFRKRTHIEFCARHAQFETRTEAQAILSRFLCSVLRFRHMSDSNVQGNTTASFHSFIHSVFCLTTSPKPPPKWCLHIVRSRASSFKWEYRHLSLRSSGSFLRLLPRRLATSISPCIFPSITCFRRQFLRKMCPIQLAFRFLISPSIYFTENLVTLNWDVSCYQLYTCFNKRTVSHSHEC